LVKEEIERTESKWKTLKFDPAKVLEIKENDNCRNSFMT